jgi:hypothetical protein
MFACPSRAIEAAPLPVIEKFLGSRGAGSSDEVALILTTPQI